MAAQTATETKSHNEYTVGWVCALSKEQTAATAMLDKRHVNLPKPPNDSNAYTLGSIGKHNVVIACLPKGHIGNNSAATVAAQMVSTFPSIRFGLMVGIGGGIPPKVRLGDVVVSTPVGSFPGVVQWDFGKAKDDGFERTGSLNNPPSSLLTAITALETEHELVGSKIPEYLDELKQKWPRLAPRYLKSDLLEDILYKADYSHVCQSSADHDITSKGDDESEEEDSCQFCDKSKATKRKPRELRVHYGLVASGNQVIKSAFHRDELNKELGGHLLCVEMEAAGLMNNFPCVVIRGICDYADSHKNKDWQEYAAAVAAAFAKELLEHVQPSDVNGERTANDMLGDVKNLLGDVLANVSTTSVVTSQMKSHLDNDIDLQILKWITPVDYGPQHSDFLRIWQPGTGKWLLDSTEYHTWMETRKQTLFCPGIPGAGKTILTSIVVDHLEKTLKTDPSIGISYIYCNYRRHEEQVIEKLFASLLKQLSQGQHSLPDCVREMYNQHKEKQTRSPLGEILTALHSVAKMYSRVFIIVDALDECQYSSGCRQTFITELFKLQGKCQANLFMTSRFIPEIVGRFKAASVSLEIRASTEDIERYLKSNIGQMPTFIQQNPELQQKIATGISEAVDGMFLLAQIYLNSLSDKVTPKAIKIALKGFEKPTPGSNEAQRANVLALAYEQAMLRINGQQSGFKDLAHQVLLWIVCAERRLTKTELQHALAVEVDALELDEDNLPSIQDMVSVCAGLVIVDDESNVIRLVHYTTQEYFNQTRQRWFPDADIIMADICATYLLFNAFESGPCQNNTDFRKRLESNPLYNYATENWGHHARKASRALPKVMEFLECKSKMNASVEALNTYNLRNKHIRDQLAGLVTSLHLAAYFGIEAIVEALLKTINVNATDWNEATPLSVAARQGHGAIVKLLLTIPGIDPDFKDGYGRTPLSQAARAGQEATVMLLLATPGVDLNTKNSYGSTPLSLAIEYGHEAVVKLLLTIPGVDLNTTDNSGHTPLFLAVKHMHEAVVKLLLTTPGVDLNTKDYHGHTPLSHAARQGHEAIVKLLLTIPGVDLNTKDYHGHTPLSHAARQGHEAIVKLLLTIPGVDLNTTDNSGHTPLFLAVKHMHKAVVKLLLTIPGVNLNTKDYHGHTPLSHAAEFEDDAIIKLLLAAGAEVNSKNLSGHTPLSFAAGRGYEAFVKLLLAVPGVNPDFKDNTGRTPLSIAAFYGYEAVVKLLLAIPDVDPNSKDNDGRTPLSIAAFYGHEAVVKLLLAIPDVDPNSKDNDGYTPLSFAAFYGHEAVVKLLLAIPDVDPNSKDNDGYTPLSFAALYGYGAIIKLSLAIPNVDPDSRDNDGFTPLLYAARIRRDAIVKLLLAAGAEDKAGTY